MSKNRPFSDEPVGTFYTRVGEFGSSVFRKRLQGNWVLIGDLGPDIFECWEMDLLEKGTWNAAFS